jgi:hypothetical protein
MLFVDVHNIRRVGALSQAFDETFSNGILRPIPDTPALPHDAAGRPGDGAG